MTAWTVMLRGIRYRTGRSLVVLLLALVATTAAVIVPAYSQAAQQSVLTDGLRAAPVTGTSLGVGAEGTSAAAPAAHAATGDARGAVSAALGRHPVLSRLLDRGVGGVETEAALAVRGPLVTRFAYRDNACAHLKIADGQCPVEPGQVLVSARTAQAQGITLGSRVSLYLGGSTRGHAPRPFEVVGIYAPRDGAEPYWGGTAYFAGAGSVNPEGAERIDAIFTGAEDDVRLDGDASVAMRIDYPLRTAEVRLADVSPLKAELGSFGLALRATDLDLQTALPDTLKEIDADQRAIGRTVPVIAVPLVLLCWFVLFLLVASLTEERGPEIALAKLRGFPSGRAARFGLGEVLLLIAFAAPLGVVAGLAVVEAAARLTLASGTHVQVRWPVFATAAVGLAAAVFAATLAARRTLRRPVLGLLRRVPERTRWQAGVAEGVAVALAGASLFAAIGDRAAPLALLAPALLAVVAGVAAARLLGMWSRLRLVVARRRGRVPALLSAAQLARRPATQRVVVVVTVAVALLSFAATAWDVAAKARRDAADDTVGASRVFTVTAAHPQALADAVSKADPRGHSMAVVRAGVPYADGRVELVGVQAQLLPAIAVWRGEDRAAVQRIATALRPRVTESIKVKDRIEVDAVASGLGTAPIRLAAVVSAPGEPPRTIALGVLGAGAKAYRGNAPECRAGCRLLGLAFAPGSSAGTPYAGSVAVRAIRSTDGPVAGHFDTANAWRVAPDPKAKATVNVRPGVTLGITVNSADDGDVIVEYADSPPALPTVLAGAAPADDPRAADFDFPGFVEQPQPFVVTERTPRLPRAGAHGLLFDLDYAVRLAERTAGLADSTQLRYEVWAGPEAPVDLAARLSGAGLQVLRTESIEGQMDRLSRRAPALGLQLYLLAGAAAVALAVGVVLLTAYIGVDARLYELAALRVVGVRRRLLRRGVLREYAALLAMPLVVGFAVGAAGAVLMLPGIPLVTAGTPAGSLSWKPGLGALPVAAAATGLGLLLTVGVVLRMLRKATPDRLRGGQ
ncbi:MAG TPA: FtsX-like permease family protein [Micromonosporaceae bacterium]|nr:FtsX-like permease family protein [Micromonosporaceae bacterium]